MSNKLQKYATRIICVILLITGNVLAQDTLDVAPGFNTLSDAIATNPDKVLRLEREGIYIIDAFISTSVPLTIIGETEPADKPPATIQMFIELGQVAGEQAMFVVGADFTLENIGLVGYTTNDEPIYMFFTASAAGIKITVNNCDLQSVETVHDYIKANSTLIFTNNRFMNLDFDNWFNGGFIGFGEENCVTHFTNNTIFMAGRALNTIWTYGENGDEIINHNTYVNVFGELYYPVQSSNFTAKNNLYYNIGIRGFVGPRAGYGGDFSDDATDSLVGHFNFKGVDPIKVISVNNNLSYTTQNVLDLHTETGATFQPMRNEGTIAIFNDNPSIVWADNLFDGEGNGVDPNFVSSLPDEVYAGMFYNARAQRDSSQQDPATFPPDPSYYPEGTSRTGLVWPFPFNFKPQNSNLLNAGDDGYPLGDLNWYGADVVAAWENNESNPLVSVEGRTETPTKFSLDQNYPNPFNPTTVITYSIKESADVTLKVYNLLGQVVATLVNGETQVGTHKVHFDAGNLTAGTYFYTISAGSFKSTKKMLLLK